MQHSLGRALPVARVVMHLQQLAGERHIVFTQTQCLAQRGAQGDL